MEHDKPTLAAYGDVYITILREGIQDAEAKVSSR